MTTQPSGSAAGRVLHDTNTCPDEDCPACIQGCLGCHRKYVRTINGYCAECVERPDEPRWVLDKNSDVWARWLSDRLYHQGNRTASLADVVRHYGPVQVLMPGRVIRDV